MGSASAAEYPERITVHMNNEASTERSKFHAIWKGGAIGGVIGLLYRKR